MAQSKTTRNVGVVFLGTFIVVGTGLAYRAVINRWEGDVKAPLFAAGAAGIAYFLLTLVTLSWTERREHLNRRGPKK